MRSLVKKLFIAKLAIFACCACSTISVAQRNYVRIRFARNGEITGQATAISVTPDLILTCHHVIDENRDLILKMGVVIVAESEEDDVALLRLPGGQFEPRAYFTTKLRQGERVIVYSNAFGLHGVYMEYIVAKILDWRIFLQGAAYKGESGAAVYNSHGQIVGMLSGETYVEDARGSLATVIPSSVLLKYFGGIYEKKKEAEEALPYPPSSLPEGEEGDELPLQYPLPSEQPPFGVAPDFWPLDLTPDYLGSPTNRENQKEEVP